jgi:hypothetical protein
VLLAARSAGELAGAAAAIRACVGLASGQARAVAADITGERQRQRVIDAGLVRRVSTFW